MAEKHEFFEEIGNHPMSEEAFRKQIIRRLDVLKTDPDGFLVVSYESPREDKVEFIQTCQMSDSNPDFRIEIGVESDGSRDFSILTRDDVPFDEMIEVFRRTLVGYETPDWDEWTDSTKEIMYGERSMKIVDRFHNLEAPTEDQEFSYVEALLFLIENRPKKRKEYLNELAWFYAERREFELERKYLRRAADLGDGNALCELGYMWYYGQHCEVDYEKAYYCFKDGLNGDDECSRLYCKYKLADMYRFGLFVEKDEEKYRELVFETLDEIGVAKNLSYPYAEVAYRAAGIKSADGNTTEAVHLLVEARRFMAERLRRHSYWGHIDVMIRIVKALYELVPFDETRAAFYDLIYLSEYGGSAKLLYRKQWHTWEVSEKMDGGIGFDGKWYESIGAFLEKCTIGGKHVTSIYDDFERMEVAV